jgi:phage N-6-adenine-methyltransferase
MVKVLERDGLFYKSKTTEWYTPVRYIEMARRVMGAIDLDPCSSAQANATIRAAIFYDKDSDGLKHLWHGRVWMNPPYSKATKAFVKKLLFEHRCGHVEQAIMLLSVNTIDRSWFNPLWQFVLCFHYGRVKFDSPDPGVEISTPPLGSVFIYIGANTTAFIREFTQIGACVSRSVLP